MDTLERAAEVESRRRVLNIGSGHGASLNELLAIVVKVVGEQPEVEYLPARELDVPENVLDIGRARAELGWRPQTELTEGIARMWEEIVTLPEGEVKY